MTPNTPRTSIFHTGRFEILEVCVRVGLLAFGQGHPHQLASGGFPMFVSDIFKVKTQIYWIPIQHRLTSDVCDLELLDFPR